MPRIDEINELFDDLAFCLHDLDLCFSRVALVDDPDARSAAYADLWRHVHGLCERALELDIERQQEVDWRIKMGTKLWTRPEGYCGRDLYTGLPHGDA